MRLSGRLRLGMQIGTVGISSAAELGRDILHVGKSEVEAKEATTVVFTTAHDWRRLQRVADFHTTSGRAALAATAKQLDESLADAQEWKVTWEIAKSGRQQSQGSSPRQIPAMLAWRRVPLCRQRRTWWLGDLAGSSP